MICFSQVIPHPDFCETKKEDVQCDLPSSFFDKQIPCDKRKRFKKK